MYAVQQKKTWHIDKTVAVLCEGGRDVNGRKPVALRKRKNQWGTQCVCKSIKPLIVCIFFFCTWVMSLTAITKTVLYNGSRAL